MMSSMEYIDRGMAKTLSEYLSMYPCFGDENKCTGKCEQNDDRLCYGDCVTLRRKIKEEQGYVFRKFDF